MAGDAQQLLRQILPQAPTQDQINAVQAAAAGVQDHLTKAQQALTRFITALEAPPADLPAIEAAFNELVTTLNEIDAAIAAIAAIPEVGPQVTQAEAAMLRAIKGAVASAAGEATGILKQLGLSEAPGDLASQFPTIEHTADMQDLKLSRGDPGLKGEVQAIADHVAAHPLLDGERTLGGPKRDLRQRLAGLHRPYGHKRVARHLRHVAAVIGDLLDQRLVVGVEQAAELFRTAGTSTG